MFVGLPGGETAAVLTWHQWRYLLGVAEEANDQAAVQLLCEIAPFTWPAPADTPWGENRDGCDQQSETIARQARAPHQQTPADVGAATVRAAALVLGVADAGATAGPVRRSEGDVR